MASESQPWVNRPSAKAYDTAYSPPKEPTNPVVRGLPLYYGAQLISRLGVVQDLLWSNAGFDKLRARPQLEGVDPRYEPTVIRRDSAQGKNTATQTAWGAGLSALSRDGYRSVQDYHAAYKVGKLTPSEVANTIIPLIKRDAKAVTAHSVAFVQSEVDLIQKAAAESTARYKEGRPLSPLDGVPVAVKDEEDLAGYQKHLGSKRDYSHPDNATSYCVQLWLDAGAVIVGKTNMHELGMDTTNNNPVYGTPLNPHNDRYYCGGSSGGSAYAVSAGLVSVAIGNDGGGSIRIPAAYCGLYGLKPSSGRISIRPTANLAKSTAVAGPIAASMSDLEIGYRVMAQPDKLDKDSKLFAPPKPQAEIEASRTKVIGIHKEWFHRADRPVRVACDACIDFLSSKLGYTVVDVSLPMIHEGQAAHALTIMSEVISGTPAVKDLTPANQVLLSVGSRTPAHDFLQAQKLRNVLMQHLAHLWEQYPGMVLVTPTTPNAGWPYHPADLRYGCTDGNMQIRNMEYVWLANFTGTPAISAPVAYLDSTVGKGRVPVGLMGMGEWCSEDELIAFGYDCERYLNDQYEGGRVMPGNFVDVMDIAANREA